MNKKRALAATPSLLSAVVLLLAYGAVERWRWQPPTTGTSAERYLVEVQFITDRPEVYLLNVERTDIRLRAAGIDSLGRVGDWGQWSDED